MKLNTTSKKKLENSMVTLTFQTEPDTALTSGVSDTDSSGVNPKGAGRQGAS